MKSFIPFLFFIFSISFLSAQEFAPVGATWTYKLFWIQGTNFPTLTSSKDTIVNNKVCKFLEGYLSCTYITPIVYEENGQVFYYDEIGDDFFLLYDFNLNAGESWTIHVPNSWLGLDSIVYIVDSVGTFTYNGNILKTQYVHPLENYGVSFSGGSDIIYENIGSGNNFFLQSHVCDPVTGPLRCYDDENVGLIKFVPEDTPCNSFGSSVENKINSKEINIYPNPFNDYIFIDTELSVQKIKIFNAQGVLIQEENNFNWNQKIELKNKHLVQGLYFVEIILEDDSKVIQKLMKY